MKQPMVIWNCICLLGCFFVVSYLVAMVFVRKTLLGEEYKKKSIFTVFPLAIRFPGFRYSGPFSRVSIYNEFVVIRILGASKVLKKNEFKSAPYIHQPWVICTINQNKVSSVIKIATNDNENLTQVITNWYRSNDGKITEQ